MRWMGLREGAVLAAPVSLGLIALGWSWPLAVWWGMGCVAASRMVALLMDRTPPARQKSAWAAMSALGGFLLMALLALGGISIGLPPLGVVAGLCSATTGLWARAWLLARRGWA